MLAHHALRINRFVHTVTLPKPRLGRCTKTLNLKLDVQDHGHILLLPEQPHEIKMEWVLDVQPQQRKAGKSPSAEIFDLQFLAECWRTKARILFEKLQ